MKFEVSGTEMFWCLVALLLVLKVAYVIVHDTVKAYRISKGKKQLMDWLEFIGKDITEDMMPTKGYTDVAVKTYLAERTTKYFHEVRDGKRW